MKTKNIFLMAMACILCTPASAQTIRPFEDGERAVFLGNSITDGGHYHSYIWLYYMTRFPDRHIRIYNGGIGGDTAGDMYKRLDGDIFRLNPTVLTVTFGMNDSGYFEYNGDNPQTFAEEKYQESIKNFRKMTERFKELSGTRIIMAGTSPYDETVKLKDNIPFKGKNSTIRRIIDHQRQTAADNGWEFTDWNGPMTALNRKGQEKDSTFTLCGTDRIHPDNDGHMVMAYLFLKAQGIAGREVARMELDARKKETVKATNCTLSNLRRDGKDFSFDYLAQSLPYPLDTVPRGWGQQKPQADALKSIPFTDEMNREILKVRGLAKGNYKLLIDGIEIRTYSAEELEQGINLATETKTPQYQQALAVMHLNEYRWEIERSFREYAWMQFNFFQKKGLLFANNRKAIEVMNAEDDGWVKAHRDNYAKLMLQPVREARQKEMESLIDRIYEINKPQTRRIVLHKM